MLIINALKILKRWLSHLSRTFLVGATIRSLAVIVLIFRNLQNLIFIFYYNLF